MEHKIAGTEKGTYALLVALNKETPIAVGRLGLLFFPAGYYVYLGSAQRGLYTRVKRHLAAEKRRHWHIDYLLDFVQVAEVWYAKSWESQECFWCRTIYEMPQGEITAKGFGSSDCRCPSHLIRFPTPPPFDLFRERLGKRGLLLKRATPREFLS